MLKILYINGSIDSEFNLNPTVLETYRNNSLGFQQDANIVALKGGKLGSIGSDGFIKLADGATDYVLGTIVNDAAGYGFENIPALASGKVPMLQGGGLVETDMVVEEDITPGVKLYAGTGSNVGLFTKTDPTGSNKGQVVAIARSANSTADKTLRIQLVV